MSQRNKSPESIALDLLFYSFIISMVVFAIFRFFGIAWFAQDYTPVLISEPGYYIISTLFKVFEGVIILRVLTNLKLRYCLCYATGYALLVLVLHNPAISTILDFVYTTSIPFIHNADKDKSIKHSVLYILTVCAYQLIMSFGRYGMPATAKWDLGYAFLSLIDYRIFLIIILLYVKRRKIKNG